MEQTGFWDWLMVAALVSSVWAVWQLGQLIAAGIAPYPRTPRVALLVGLLASQAVALIGLVERGIWAELIEFRTGLGVFLVSAVGWMAYRDRRRFREMGAKIAEMERRLEEWDG